MAFQLYSAYSPAECQMPGLFLQNSGTQVGFQAELVGKSKYLILDGTYKSMNDRLQDWLEEPSICDCGSPMATSWKYDQPPSLLVFSLNTARVPITKTIHIKGSHSKFTVLPLRGMIYSGGFYFTSCTITPGKEVWYNNGLVTRRNCIKKGHPTDFTKDSLKTCVEKNSSGESVEQQEIVVI